MRRKKNSDDSKERKKNDNKSNDEKEKRNVIRVHFKNGTVNVERKKKTKKRQI